MSRAIRRIDAGDTHHLRQMLLRPHQRIGEMEWDHDAEGVHFGAFVDDDLVGITTLVPQPREAVPGGWRVRGMAVVPDLRGHGIGAALLAAAVDTAWEHDAAELWCTARTPAARFYAVHGFEAVSDVFELPDIGPHVIMRRAL